MTPLTKRDYEIFIARAFGQSLARIGDRHSISPERVRQIISKCLRRLMKAEEKWAAAERACTRIQAECKAKRIEERARIVDRDEAGYAVFPVLEPTIEHLNLPVRVFNVLRNDGKETLEQICQMTAADFLRIKNAGSVSLRHLREELDRIKAPHNLGTYLVSSDTGLCRLCGMPETNCCCG